MFIDSQFSTASRRLKSPVSQNSLKTFYGQSVAKRCDLDVSKAIWRSVQAVEHFAVRDINFRHLFSMLDGWSTCRQETKYAPCHLEWLQQPPDGAVSQSINLDDWQFWVAPRKNWRLARAFLDSATNHCPACCKRCAWWPWYISSTSSARGMTS